VGDEDESFRGRNVQRNVAYVDLAFSSALRRQEIGTLLVTDLPSSVCEEPPLARAVAKHERGRRWRSSNNVLAAVHAYIRHARQDAVMRAHRASRYEALDPILVTDAHSSARGAVLALANGRRWRVDDLGDAERRRLIRQNSDGVAEPLWLWLNEDGTPMRAKSWNQVFRVANLRFAAELVKLGRHTDVAWLSPHSLRFSYGLHLLVALHKALDQRNPPGSRVYDPSRYDLAYNVVAALLGHKNEAVTRSVYLAPLQQDRLWESAAFTDDDVATALEDVARADPRVLDLCRSWR
jgi:integrase